MATKYKYDKNTDYATLMERAAQRGDNAAAAIYEQQRNAKIRGEGMTDQEQTNDYLQYLPVEDVPDYDDTHRREAETLLSERGTTGQRDRIDQMLDALLGEEFDYDPASDKLFAYERYSGERKTRLSAIDSLLDAADSRDGVTKAQIAALLDMDDADYTRADSKLQQQAKDLADAKAAADKKAKDEKDAAEKDAAAQEKAAKAARSEARRQITLILRNGGTVPDDLWQQSGYNAVTIAAMLRGRKG